MSEGLKVATEVVNDQYTGIISKEQSGTNKRLDILRLLSSMKCNNNTPYLLNIHSGNLITDYRSLNKSKSNNFRNNNDNNNDTTKGSLIPKKFCYVSCTQF